MSKATTKKSIKKVKTVSEEKQGFLHFLVIHQGSNLNYGEGYGNMSILKKISIDDEQRVLVSSQAITFSIKDELQNKYGYPMAPVSPTGDKKPKTYQYHSDATIDKYIDIDLFGYLKTEKEKKAKSRKKTAVISRSISVTPYMGDVDFMVNIGLVHRAETETTDNSIALKEEHKGFYVYDVIVDLHRFGVDVNYDMVISNEERARRIQHFLCAIRDLSRTIKGERSDLTPYFVIGGLYDYGNPRFQNTVKYNKGFDFTEMNEVLDFPDGSNTVKEKTILGARSIFKSIAEDQVDLTPVLSIPEFFNQLIKKVKEYYGVK